MTPATGWAVRYRLVSILGGLTGGLIAIGAALLLVNRDLETPEIWGVRGSTGAVALKKLLDEVERSVSRPDPERFARRFLDTAVEVTDARGGEVRLPDGRRSVSLSSPGWTHRAEPELVAPIRN